MSECKCENCPCPPDCQDRVKRYIMDPKIFLEKLVIMEDELLEDKCPNTKNSAIK